MSLTRAFTTRRVKQSLEAAEEARAARRESDQAQAKNIPRSAAGSVRYKISAPVELIHTTNMLSYNAPDILQTTTSQTTHASKLTKVRPLMNTSSSTKSDDDTDSPLSSASTPPTSPDASGDDRPTSPELLNHLSSYFTTSKEEPVMARPPVPAIPSRTVSSGKKATYENLGRQRSVASRMSEQSNRSTSTSTKAGSTFSRVSSTSTTASSVPPTPIHASKMSSSSIMAQSPPPATPSFPSQLKDLSRSPSKQAHPRQHQQPHVHHASHPFGRELAQVSELAEEYSPKPSPDAASASRQQHKAVMDEEECELKSRGLCKFTAEDYLRDIQDLVACFFAEARPRPTAALWI